MTSPNPNQKIISVFGSHGPKPGSQDYEVAWEMGKLLADSGFSVATGGYEGAMAAVSQGAAEVGGHVIGVTSKQVELTRSTILNAWVKQEIRYHTLADRLVHLVSQNNGMIVLPGGIGTLSELALAWSLIQVGEISLRPLIIVGPMWQETIDVLARTEYIMKSQLELVLQAKRPADAITILNESIAKIGG
jgi:hypothetical protein